MSVTVTLNGQTHVVPVVREKHWGNNVTSYLQDIAEVLDGTFQNISATTGSTSIDFNNGKNVHLDLHSSTTLTLLNPREGRGSVFHIKYFGIFSPTFPASVKWLRGGPGNTPPLFTAINARRDIVTLVWDPIDSVYIGESGLNAPW